MRKSESKSDEQNKKQHPTRIISNIRYLLAFAWKISPRFLIGYILDAVVIGAVGVLDAYYIKVVFDLLDKRAPVIDIVRVLCVVGILFAVGYLFDIMYWDNENVGQRLYIKYGLQVRLFGHALSLDIAKYEVPEFYNDFIWSLQSADNNLCEMMNDLRKLVRGLVQGMAVFGILLTLDLLTAAFIAAASLFGTFCSNRINKILYAYDMDSRKAGRVADYVHRVHYLSDYAKELRISRAWECLDDLYDDHIKEKNSLIGKYHSKINRIVFVWGTVGALKDNGIILLLLYRMMISKTILLGGFSLGVTSAWRVSSSLRNVINGCTKMAQHSLYIEKLRTFFAAKSDIVGGEEQPTDFECVEFRDVSFAYEDGNYVLSHVSFKIGKGEKIAIVGYNGAGKTTLIKLLMRFYDVTDGEILYNGIDIRKYDLAAYRETIGAVFQDFKIFAATVAENVVSGIFDEKDRARVTRALAEADFSERLSGMAEGIDTPLTREFCDDGVNLSGGENQKIAIARALYKNAHLTVMDEPSSALDPVAEYALNRHIQTAVGEKTVIFISHRLSTTRDADCIYMFEKGCIIERGSHDRLIADGGKYAAMFNLQAEKYRV